MMITFPASTNIIFREMIRASRGGMLLLLAAIMCVFADQPLYAAATAASADRPHIVFIMADDMGYGDPRCYNPDSQIPTPNIDRLAKEGMRFTDAHAPGAVCVPTRYGLLTGRYPFRMQRGGNSRIRPDRVTLGSLLQQHGYTTGCIGKWHLGLKNWKNPDCSRPLTGGPVDRGFDSYFGIPASLDIPPYYYIEDDRCVAAPTETIEENHSPDVRPIQGAFWRAGNIAPGFKHREVLPKFTEKAVAFIDRRAERAAERPFFLYLALQAPHTPWLPTGKFQGTSEAGDYGDFTVQVDHSVGRVLQALDRHGLADNTLVVFTSDNGPVWYADDANRYGHWSTGPLRGMKGDAWEGGHRMPFLARWPGRIPEGTVSRETICFTDMLATFAAILGTDLPPEAGADSYNILPALLGEERDAPIRKATIHQSSGRVLAIRQGKWKLIPQLGSGGFTKPRRVKPEPDGPKGQLYNLEKDLGETNNLWSERPEVVERLTKLLERYENSERTAPRLTTSE